MLWFIMMINMIVMMLIMIPVWLSIFRRLRMCGKVVREAMPFPTLLCTPWHLIACLRRSLGSAGLTGLTGLTVTAKLDNTYFHRNSSILNIIASYQQATRYWNNKILIKPVTAGNTTAGTRARLFFFFRAAREKRVNVIFYHQLPTGPDDHMIMMSIKMMIRTMSIRMSNYYFSQSLRWAFPAGCPSGPTIRLR